MIQLLINLWLINSVKSRDLIIYIYLLFMWLDFLCISNEKFESQPHFTVTASLFTSEITVENKIKNTSTCVSLRLRCWRTPDKSWLRRTCGRTIPSPWMIRSKKVGFMVFFVSISSFYYLLFFLSRLLFFCCPLFLYLNHEYAYFFFISKFIKRAELNPLAGPLWPTGHMFGTPILNDVNNASL